MATIESASSIVSAPAWFDSTPVHKPPVHRKRWNYYRARQEEASASMDRETRNDTTNAFKNQPIGLMAFTLQTKSKECIDNNNNNHQAKCDDDNDNDDLPEERDSTERDDNDGIGSEHVDDESMRQQEESMADQRMKPLADDDSCHESQENDDSIDRTDDEAEDIAPSASFTTLSALSLVTPPNQWIPKDSFLYQRKKLEQWGIPLTPDMKKTTARRLQPRHGSFMEHEQYVFEQALHERLVWVKYKNQYWWPAILYDNYRQLLDDESLMRHVWYRIPLFWQRLELALTVVFHPHDPRNQKHVARVLGRGTAHGTDIQGTIEVIEVEVEDTWPFKDEDKLALILKEMALHGDVFRDHPSLYLDWHRGLDEMEQLLRDCLAVDNPQMEENVSESLAAKQAQWKVRYQQKKRAKAFAATLTAITKSAPDNPAATATALEEKEEESSLFDSSILSGQSPYEISLAPATNVPVVKRNRTWLQRAKEVERQQVIAKCHACSTQILECIESICVWKDNLVAAALE